MRAPLPHCPHEQSAAVAKAFEALQSWDFFAAHEHFERAWQHSDGSMRTVLRALAQIAASHHQLTLGRGRAAVRTWHKARAKLVDVGLDVSVLCDRMDTLHASLGLGAEGPRFFTYQRARLASYRSLPMLDEAMLKTPIA